MSEEQEHSQTYDELIDSLTESKGFEFATTYAKILDLVVQARTLAEENSIGMSCHVFASVPIEEKQAIAMTHIKHSPDAMMIPEADFLVMAVPVMFSARPFIEKTQALDNLLTQVAEPILALEAFPHLRDPEHPEYDGKLT